MENTLCTTEGTCAVYDLKEQETLFVGGAEGPKIVFEMCMGENSTLSLGRVVRKKCETIGAAAHVVRKVNILRGRGYPVPPVCMYGETSGEAYTYMSDLSEGGRYFVWGLSANQTPQEQNALEVISPTLQELNDTVGSYADRMDGDDIFAYHDVWAIRREKIGGSLEAFVLDPTTLYLDEYRPPCASGNSSKQEASIFTDKALERLSGNALP